MQLKELELACRRNESELPINLPLGCRLVCLVWSLCCSVCPCHPLSPPPARQQLCTVLLLYNIPSAIFCYCPPPSCLLRSPTTVWSNWPGPRANNTHNTLATHTLHTTKQHTEQACSDTHTTATRIFLRSPSRAWLRHGCETTRANHLPPPQSTTPWQTPAPSPPRDDIH